MSASCPSCGTAVVSGLMDAIEEIVRLREEGQTLESIGATFGYTRERVRQVIAEYEARTGQQVIPPPRESKAVQQARMREAVRASREREREAFWSSYIGQRFGSLVVTDMLREPNFKGELMRKALCRCDCGVVSKVEIRNLTRGATTSCGSQGHGHKRGWYRTAAPPNVVHIPQGHP